MKTIINYILGIGLLLFIIFIFVCRPFLMDYSIQHNKRYTIGYTIRQTYARGIIGVEYKYTVNNIDYFGDSRSYNNTVIPNGRYLVVFSSKSPQWNKILLDKLLSRNIKTPPPEGWANAPE